MKLIKKVKRKIIKIISKFIDGIKPFIRKRKYLGYDLYYSKGTSLIERIEQKGSIYEPETCAIIIDSIKNRKNPCVIDIGANIGLISLFIINQNPDVKIFAFEPGPHQNMLFRKTIIKNKLTNSIELFDVALSNEIGETTFCVHNTRDVSGDGFRDTGIAGDFKEIKVKTTTLDEWWANVGKPNIDLIKCDTEGAELLVFQGAQKLIQTCAPIIFFEMHPSLYTTYNYSHYDIFFLLEDNSYIIHSDEGTHITRDNIEKYINKFANYIATPISSTNV